MIKIDGLHFQPWIGEKYHEQGKLLLLGESHYMEEEADAEDDFSAGYDHFTTKVIRDVFLAGKYMRTPFYKNTGLLFYPDDASKIWNEVAFANVIQVGLSQAKTQPEPKEIDTIAPAFKLLLDHLQPQKVIVLSRRMWENWVPEPMGHYVTAIEAGGKNSTVWKFNYADGQCLATGIKHPSRMFGNTCYTWKPLVDKFLSLTVD